MYQTYADDIYKFFLAHVRSAVVAEALTADTFTQAEHQTDISKRQRNRAWLHAIAQRCLADHQGEKHAVVPARDAAVRGASVEPSPEPDKHPRIRAVIAAVHTLPADMRSVVTLRFLQGMTVRDTALVLDLSEANVRVLQYRALKKLKSGLV